MPKKYETLALDHDEAYDKLIKNIIDGEKNFEDIYKKSVDSMTIKDEKKRYHTVLSMAHALNDNDEDLKSTLEDKITDSIEKDWKKKEKAVEKHVKAAVGARGKAKKLGDQQARIYLGKIIQEIFKDSKESPFAQGEENALDALTTFESAYLNHAAASGAYGENVKGRALTQSLIDALKKGKQKKILRDITSKIKEFSQKGYATNQVSKLYQNMIPLDDKKFHKGIIKHIVSRPDGQQALADYKIKEDDVDIGTLAKVENIHKNIRTYVVGGAKALVSQRKDAAHELSYGAGADGKKK